MKKLRLIVLFIGLSFILNACVTGPTNQTWVTPHNRIHFSGYASKPGAVIEIKAYNKRRRLWTTVGTATSESRATALGSDTLYFWHTNVLFTSQAQWQCFWGSNTSGLECSIPPGSAYAKVKVSQVGLIDLITFERGFFSCVNQKLNAGKGGIAAGYECRSPSSPILTLRWLT